MQSGFHQGPDGQCKVSSALPVPMQKQNTHMSSAGSLCSSASQYPGGAGGQMPALIVCIMIQSSGVLSLTC